MKTTDWRWSGRGRRHGHWHIKRLGGLLLFKTAESPRWFLRLGPLHAAWWPNDKQRLVVQWWGFRP